MVMRRASECRTALVSASCTMPMISRSTPSPNRGNSSSCTSIGTVVVRCPSSASRLIARLTSSAVSTFGRSAPTDRRASVRCVRARSTAVSMLRATDWRQRAGFALCALELHQDRRESLREVVVDVAREAVALLEDRLPALFHPLQFDDPAVMQRQRRLPGDRLDQRDAPPLSLTAVALLARAERDPSQVPVADQEWRDERHAEPLRRMKSRSVGGHPLVVGAVLDCLVPAGLIRKQMTPQRSDAETRVVFHSGLLTVKTSPSRCAIQTSQPF